MRRIAAWSAVGLLVAAGSVMAWLLSPYQGFPGAEVVVQIPPGATAAETSAILTGAGVIRSGWVFRGIVRAHGSAGRLQAGEYRFQGRAGPVAVHRTLVEGMVLLREVTIPEGLRVDEVAALLEGAGIVAAEAFREAASDPSLVLDVDPQALDLEGYLFPDTYRFPRDYPAPAVARRMVQRFREVFDADRRRRADELGMSLRQVVTLASLVEEETAHPDERALVAAVFHNRLRRGMLLQCDPTVIFALAREGRAPRRLTRQDLGFDSPYNTYLYPGLPPGPIASPGEEAMEATLRPAETDYLYFVSRNDGSHQFSRHLEEHQRAVNRYQRGSRRR